MHPTLRRQTTNEQAQKKERKGMREREREKRRCLRLANDDVEPALTFVQESIFHAHQD